MSSITQLSTRITAVIAAFVFSASVAAAQGPAYKKDIPAKLAKTAKITEDSAAKVAQAKLPAGKIEAVELENEHGKLQY
ncbi:MAG: PepSY domain-containing protein, partial [Gemmatimonadales bacterium]